MNLSPGHHHGRSKRAALGHRSATSCKMARVRVKGPCQMVGAPASAGAGAGPARGAAAPRLLAQRSRSLCTYTPSATVATLSWLRCHRQSACVSLSTSSTPCPKELSARQRSSNDAGAWSQGGTLHETWQSAAFAAGQVAATGPSLCGSIMLTRAVCMHDMAIT